MFWHKTNYYSINLSIKTLKLTNSFTMPTIHAAKNTDTFKRRLKTFLFCKFYQLPLPTDFM